MKKQNAILMLVALMAAIFSQSCEKGRSYSELLNDENRDVNRFLADQWVITEIPADTVFQIGPTAPYYQLDGEGNIYMQVLKLGDGGMAREDQMIYFRFTRYNLAYYNGDIANCPSEGNQDDLSQSPTSFRFQNYSIPSSSQWGSGIQLPLEFIPINSEINLVVKSQYGWTSEISYVVPYLYNIRYFKSQI
ncbi:MAG: DUF4827 domain-containing protein [Barnesiella sp.]|nr:DUF4827 domain-containing protein [Barnesiella sp.]